MIFRPATQDEIDYIARNLRPADRREAAVFHDDPETGLRVGWRKADTVYTARVDGVPAVAMGVHPMAHNGSGKVWLLGTPRCERRPKALFKEARRWRDRWLQRWSPLWNVVDTRNKMHVRWIKAVGFTLGRTITLDGHDFRIFSISR